MPYTQEVTNTDYNQSIIKLVIQKILLKKIMPLLRKSSRY